MEELQAKESFLDLNRAIIISNIYAVFVTLLHFFSYYFFGGIEKLQILKPYFLSATSAGNIITIYFWALLDSFTICSILLIILKIKDLLISPKNDFSRPDQITN